MRSKVSSSIGASGAAPATANGEADAATVAVTALMSTFRREDGIDFSDMDYSCGFDDGVEQSRPVLRSAISGKMCNQAAAASRCTALIRITVETTGTSKRG